MKRAGVVVTITAIVALAALGVACAQNAPSTYDRGWSHMMMGPMAGCPMGAADQSLMGSHVRGRQGMMGSGMMGQGAGHMGWQRQGGADIGPQVTRLRETLGIRAEQQSAWDAYAAAATADSRSMFDMRNRMMGFMQGQATSGPDWLRVHRDMMRARADSLDVLAGAVDRLYGALDAPQKATFDRYGGGMCGAW